MKSPLFGPPTPQRLAAYLEGELDGSDSAAVARHLSESSDARQQLEQLQGIRDALSDFGNEFDQVDLLPSIRARIRERDAMRTQPSQGFFARLLQRPAVALFATGLVTAAVCLGIARGSHDHAADAFRAKSANPVIDSARWAGVQAYRVHAGKSELLGDSFAPTDGLLFSYTNLGSVPLTNLMIFAIDSRREVHWFHPAYEREGTNPSSIAISGSAAQVPLAELVQDEFPAGDLAIHALFSNRPLHVLEVEGWLKDAPQLNLVERAPGSVDQVITTRVEP